MQTEQLVATHRNGNLHLNISGDFDTTLASDASSAISRQYRGHENVFIHTAKLGELLPTGVETFLDSMEKCPVQREKLFMVGEKGIGIAPTGSRVIIPPPRKKSCGNCKKCSCQ